MLRRFSTTLFPAFVAVAGLLLPDRGAHAQGSFVPIHRYNFNNGAGSAADGAEITDLAGTAHGAVRGSGATFSGSRIALPGGASASSPYVDLPNGLLSTQSTNNGGSGKVTFEGWTKVTGVRGWARILDFGSTTGGELTSPGGGGEGRNYFFYSASIGTDVNRRRIDVTVRDTGIGGGNEFTTATFNQDCHFVITWDEASGLVVVYENGVQVGAFTTPAAMNAVTDVNVWLGRSNWVNDENMQGEFDEFRVYDKVFPPEHVRASFAVGPDSLATGAVQVVRHPTNVVESEARPVSFSTLAAGDLPITYQWYRNGAIINDATNTTYSIGSISGGDNGAQFFAVASNLVDGTPYVSTSQVATLTVLGDTNPPTVLQARIVGSNAVEVLFSERVRPDEATNPASYTVTGTNAPTVVSATLSADGTRVVLLLSDVLTPCESYVVGVSNVKDISGNAVPSGSSAGLWNYSPAGLRNRYTFNNAPGNASGATVPDIISGADGVVRNGSGTTTFTGNRVTLGGGSSSLAPYVDLPNGLLTANSTNNGGSGQVTLETWVKVTGNRNWSRIFDFGSVSFNELPGPGGSGNGERYIMLSAQIGTDVNNVRFEMTGASGLPGAFTRDFANGFNQDQHFVMTWDEASGTLQMFRNGVLQTTVSAPVAFTNVQDVNVWLGRSNWTGDDNMEGEFDEFRVYSRVINTNEIQLNSIGGPDNNFGAITSLNLTLQTNSMVTNTVAPVSVLAGFATAGVQDIARSGCVRYSSTDSNVAYIRADGVLEVGNVGTATLTAALGPFSDSETIEVSADSIPPFMVRARVNTLRQIELVYSEPVDQGTAEEASNYAVDGPSGPYQISSVVRQDDQARVLINLDTPLNCEFITLTVSFVADQSPLFNQIAENSTLSVYNFIPTGLRHRYTFNNSATANGSGLTVLDGIGTADGLIQGAGSSFTGDKLVLPGGGSGAAAYVDLPNGLMTENSTNNGGSGQITFEGWVRVTGGRTWSRILDIGNSGPCCATGGEITGPGGSGEGIDYLMLSAQVDNNVNARRFEIMNRDHPNNAGTITIDHATAFNQMRQFVITWDERTGALQVYEDGVLLITTSTSIPMTANQDVNVWLGRSNWTGDQNMQGEFDEFRVYNRVLSSAEILRNRTLGPDLDFGALTSLDLTLGSSTMLVGRTAPVSVVGGFSLAGLQELATSSCVQYSSADSNVAFISADGVIHAVGAGTTTVQVDLGGSNDVETITVEADVEKPTLVNVIIRSTRTLELVFSEPVDQTTAEQTANYIVGGASGNATISSVQRLSDPSRVLITLAAPLPCEYVTVAVSNVADAYGNTIVASSSVGATHYSPVGLQHRYTFNTAPIPAAAGTIVPDTVGTGDAVLLGGGVSLTGSRVVLAGGASATASYVDLPNGLLSANSLNNGGSGRVSIEGWAKVTGNRSWSRLFDFGSNIGGELFGPGGGGNEGLDYFFLSAQDGGNVNRHVVDIRNVDGTPTSDPGGPGFNGAPFNTDFHFVVTWDELTDQVVVYENGAQVASFSTGGTPMSQMNDVNCWLGRSNWTTDQNMQGEFDEVRVYSRALSLGEVQLNQQLGPDKVLGQPLALTIGGTNHVQIGTRLQNTVLVDFSNVSGLDFTASGCVRFESGNTNVLSIDASGVKAVGLGTADLIARFSGLSNSIPVTVGYQFTLTGMAPGAPYSIQVAPEVTGPWTTIATQNAALDGTIAFEDTVFRGPQAFYRATAVP